MSDLYIVFTSPTLSGKEPGRGGGGAELPFVSLPNEAQQTQLLNIQHPHVDMWLELVYYTSNDYRHTDTNLMGQVIGRAVV